VIKALLQDEMPDLSAHFLDKRVDVFILC